jgi:hypothetical protein
MNRYLLAALLALTTPAAAQTVLDPKQVALVCAYNSGGAPTPVAGQYYFVQCDSTGRLITSGGGGGGGTPGGVSGNVQFNNAGAFGGMGGTSWDDTNRSLTITGATVTTSNPVLNLSQTWNAAGVTFTGLLYNVTNTASATGSLLADLQVGGTSKFSVAKTGAVVSQSSIYAVGGLVASAANGVQDSSGTQFSISSSGTLLASGAAKIGFSASNPLVPDTWFQRVAAATLQLGAADAAAPVAQTLEVQSVVAGTSNTAGANFTINGSVGTGTGAGGSIIFRAAPAGTTGTAQNAPATYLTIDPTNKAVTITGTVPGLSGSYSLIAGTNGSAVAGWYIGSNAGGNFQYWQSAAHFGMSSTIGLGWYSGFANANTSPDTLLTRAGAATLQLGAADAAAPVAQTFQVQSVVAGTTNTAGANWTLRGSESSGSGVGGDIIIQTSAANAAATTQNSPVTIMTLKGSATTTNNPGRVLVAGQIESSGSVPTAAGAGGTCATGAIAGGANAGTVTLTGACANTNTVTLTFKTAAATGWACNLRDRTAPAAQLNETSTTTSTAVFTLSTTLTGSTATGATDVLQYDCTAY